MPSGAAAAFWALVNQRNSTSVQVYLESPISIQFLDDGALAAPESLDVLLPHEPTSSLAAKIAVVLMPIAVVMGLLQILLVYLLKDAELLQAHWGSEERLGGKVRPGRRRHSTLSPRTVGIEAIPSHGAPPRHESDVELFASSDLVLASWAALQPTIALHRLHADGIQHAFDVRLADAELSPTLSRLALTSNGEYIGALDAEGRMGVWRLVDDLASCLALPNNRPRSPIVALAAFSESSTSPACDRSTSAPFAPGDSSPAVMEASPTFATVHVDGSAHVWSCDADGMQCRPLRDATWPGSVSWKALPRSASLLSGTADDGSMLLLPLDAKSPDACLRLTSAGSDPIETVSRLTSANAAPLDLVAAARKSGSIELYDLAQRYLVGQVDAFEGRPQRVELVPSRATRKCPWCAVVIAGGCLLVASSRTHLKVFEVFGPPADADEECVCRSGLDTRGPPVSPTLSRVTSMNTSSRRFSPRKKSITPARPPQPVFTANSSLRPPLPPPARSSSSSNSSSPERERRNGHAGGIPEPPPRSAPPSPRVSPSLPPVSLPPLTPVKDQSAKDDGNERRSPAEASEQLRIVEVASLALGHRNRWCIVGGQVIGVRRAAELMRDDVSSMEDYSAWEMWALTLGEEGGAFDAGFAESSAPLADVLPPSADEASPLATPEAPPNGSHLSPGTERNGLDQPLLRNRRPSATQADAAASLPSDTSLPFSHIRPLLSVFGGRAAAAGLGNRILVVRAAQGLSIPAVRASSDGFLGL